MTSIETIPSVLILTKSFKTANKSTKEQFVKFLFEMAIKFHQNVGMLIALARGIYQYADIKSLKVTN